MATTLDSVFAKLAKLKESAAARFENSDEVEDWETVAMIDSIIETCNKARIESQHYETIGAENLARIKLYKKHLKESLKPDFTAIKQLEKALQRIIYLESMYLDLYELTRDKRESRPS